MIVVGRGHLFTPSSFHDCEDRMFPRIILIMATAFLVATSSHAANKDPRSLPISPQELKQSIQRTPLTFSKHLRLIARARSSHLAAVAYQQYTARYNNDPKNAQANLIRGVAAMSYWEYATSSAVNELSPTSSQAHDLLSVSSACLRKAADTLPNSADAKKEYGHFLWRYGLQMEKGLAYLQKAVALAPDDAVAHAFLGEAYSNPFYKKGYDSKAAEHELVQSIRLDPSYAYAHWKLMFLYADLKRYREAQRQMQTFLDMEPGEVAQEPFVKLMQSAINKGLNKS